MEFNLRIFQMFLLNLLVNSVRDHNVISDIFGFNLAHTTSSNPADGKMSDKETKIEALGMVMRLLLRSSALLTVSYYSQQCWEAQHSWL